MSHTLTLGAAVASLGRALERLAEHPALRDSPGAAELLRHAAGFHAVLDGEVQGLVRENDELRAQVSALSGHPVGACHEGARHDAAEYLGLKEAGAAPAEVAAALRADGLEKIVALRTLRALYGLSLPEALAVWGPAGRGEGDR